MDTPGRRLSGRPARVARRNSSWQCKTNSGYKIMIRHCNMRLIHGYHERTCNHQGSDHWISRGGTGMFFEKKSLAQGKPKKKNPNFLAHIWREKKSSSTVGKTLIFSGYNKHFSALFLLEKKFLGPDNVRRKYSGPENPHPENLRRLYWE